VPQPVAGNNKNKTDETANRFQASGCTVFREEAFRPQEGMPMSRLGKL